MIQDIGRQEVCCIEHADPIKHIKNKQHSMAYHKYI